MSSDNVAHWRPSLSRRSSFLQLHRLGGVRIVGKSHATSTASLKSFKSRFCHSCCNARSQSEPAIKSRGHSPSIGSSSNGSMTSWPRSMIFTSILGEHFSPSFSPNSNSLSGGCAINFLACVRDLESDMRRSQGRPRHRSIASQFRPSPAQSGRCSLGSA